LAHLLFLKLDEIILSPAMVAEKLKILMEIILTIHHILIFFNTLFTGSPFFSAAGLRSVVLSHRKLAERER
jgi:hypothetical protein